MTRPYSCHAEEIAAARAAWEAEIRKPIGDLWTAVNEDPQEPTSGGGVVFCVAVGLVLAFVLALFLAPAIAAEAVGLPVDTRGCFEAGGCNE